MSYSTEILSDSPIAYWKLDEASGTIYDSTANNHDSSAQALGSYSNTSTGILSDCVFFDSHTDYITIPDDADWDISDNLTLELWVNSSTNSASGSILYHSYPGPQIMVHGTDNKIWVNVGGKSSPGWHKSSTTISTATWYHVVVVCSGSSAKLYIDGSLDTDFSTGTGNIDYPTTNVTLGNHISDRNYGHDGYLSDVAIYNTALTSTQVSDHYNAASSVDIDVDATTATVTLAGQDASASSTGNPTVPADVATVTYAGLDATVSAEASVIVSVDNVATVSYLGLEIRTTLFDTLYDRPIALWNFQRETYSDDISGNNLQLGTGDYSIIDGDPHAGTGTVVPGSEGALDTAMQFDAADQLWEADLGQQVAWDWTIEMRVDFDSIPALDAWGGPPLTTVNSEVVFSMRNDDGFAGNPHVGTTSTRPTIILSRGQVDPESYNYFLTFQMRNTNVTVDMGESTPGGWKHLAITSTKVDTSDFSFTAYLNGINVGSSGTIDGEEFWVPRLTDATDVFRFGSQFYRMPAYDDLIIFDRTLTDGTIYGHVAGVFDNTETVDSVVDVQYTGLDATVTGEMNRIISVDLADITVSAYAPILDIDGFLGVTADPAEIVYEAFAPTLTSESTIIQSITNTPTITVTPWSTGVFTRPDELTYSLISSSDIGFTAADAETIDSLDFGVQFKGQSKILSFRIGNTSPVKTNFLITVGGLNPILYNASLFSLDKVAWSEYLLIENVPDNGVTDVIYVKLEMPESAYNGDGSFVISVEQDV